MLKHSLKNNLSLLVKIFLTTALVMANLQMVLAADTVPTPPTFDRNQYSSFNVKTNLSTDTSTNGKQDQTYLTSSNPVAAFILQGINLIALTAASLSFLAVVVAGFLMMSSAGNETQWTKGKDIMTRALVGLAITLSAYFIVSFVQNLFFETVAK